MIETSDYVENIKNYIENNIVSNKVRNLEKERDKLTTYWKVGKEIVKAQEEDKIKYGNSFIKELSVDLTELYGLGYDYSNLRRMKNFCLLFPNWATLSLNFMTWSHMREILPIKEENKRNYYINLVNQNYLSVRQLRNEIKNQAFERLDDKIKNNILLNEQMNTFDYIKDPILIEIKDIKDKELSERALQKSILNQIKDFMLQLGKGFAFIGEEYKLNVGNNYRYVDLLFFNYLDNCFYAMELKANKLKPADVGQLEFYVNYIDSTLKQNVHNDTKGILVCKESDKNILPYINKNNLKIISFKVIEGNGIND